MKQPEPITLLSMQRQAQIGCTPDVDRVAAQLKQAPQTIGFKKDQRLVLWTASRLENRFHTSPVVPKLGLKWPQVNTLVKTTLF